MSARNLLTRAVKQSFNEFTANSSIHGLKYFSRKGWILRIMWMVVLLFAIVSAIFLVFVFWKDYLSNPTRIIVENRKAALAEIPFPAVAVCVPRKLSSKSIDRLLKNLTIPAGINATNLRSALPMLSLFFETESSLVNEDELDLINKVFTYNNVNIRQVMHNMRPKCDDYIMRCKWNGMLRNCSEIFRKELTIIGYCCAFNYKPFNSIDLNFTYTRTDNYGYKSGLTLIVSQKKKFPKSLSISPILDLFMVVIHESRSFAGLDAYVTAIEPGNEYFFGVQVSSISSANDVRMLQVQDRDCVFPDEVKLKYFRDYRNYDCQLERHMKALINACGCQTYVYPSNSGDVICNVTRIPCITKFNADETTLESTLYTCPLLCDLTVLKIDSTFGKLSLDGSNVDDFYDDLSPDDAVVHVFYESQFIFGKKRVLVHSWTNLLSNFGGVFSLFLGCSFVSILEIVFYVFVRFPINLAVAFKDKKKETSKMN